MTNIRQDGTLRSDPASPLTKSLAGNERWHHDSTYMPVQAKGAVFTAEVVPARGGETGFADMRAAYDALDEPTRVTIAGLCAHHSRRYSMERAGHHVSPDDAGRYQLYGYDVDEPPLRPLVKTHPDTGRPNLLIGQHAYGIPGMTAAESEALLGRLGDEACAPGHAVRPARAPPHVAHPDRRRPADRDGGQLLRRPAPPSRQVR